MKIVCSDDKCFFTCSSNALAPKHTTKIRRPNDSRHALPCGGNTNILFYPQKIEKSVREAAASICCWNSFSFLFSLLLYSCQSSCEKWMRLFCQLYSFFILYKKRMWMYSDSCWELYLIRDGQSTSLEKFQSSIFEKKFG